MRTTKTQQSVLVGLAGTQRAIDEQPLREEQFGGADVQIGAAVFRTQRPGQSRAERARFCFFVLSTDSDLRHPVVAVQNRIPSNLDLQAHDVLPQMQAGQAQGGEVVVRVQILMCQGQLHAVTKGERRTGNAQTIVLGFHTRDESGAAPLAVGRITARHRPGREASTGGTVNAADTAGEQQFAALGLCSATQNQSQ